LKILLVNPQYPDTFWSFRHALRFISKKATFPPLGLLTVAAMLPGEPIKTLNGLIMCLLVPWWCSKNQPARLLTTAIN